ncbi:pyridoxal-phosphate dependent enzyme [Escherichia coli]
MPDNMSQERRAAMRAYGAELILSPKSRAWKVRAIGAGDGESWRRKAARSVHNPDNPYAHYTTTGPEIWQQTGGRITHCRSAWTTRTITGVSRFMREQSKPVTIVGLQPEEAAAFPAFAAGYGISAGIFNASRWMRCWIFISAMRKTPCANWRCGKEYSWRQLRRRDPAGALRVAKLTPVRWW